MYQIACDPNNFPLENPFSFGIAKGPYGARRKCFQKRDLLAYSVDYAMQFFDTYKDKRKYFSLRATDAHEFTGELANMSIDPEVTRLMEHLDKGGHLDNTIVRIFADHGDHVNPIGYKTVSGKVERYNPFMFTIIPEHLKESIGKNLEINSQRLLIAYDYFASDIKLLGAKKEYKYGEDYYQQIIPENRTCENMYLWNFKTECFCNFK